MSKKEPNRFRKHQIHFYVNDAELQMINERIDYCHCNSLREYARKMMIDGWIFVFNGEEELKQFNYEINKIGTNINQIAHAVNVTGTVSEKELKDIKEMLNKIWQLQRSMQLEEPLINL